MTQLTNLLNLATSIQEAILMGTLVTSERKLREASGLVLWVAQREVLAP